MEFEEIFDIMRKKNMADDHGFKFVMEPSIEDSDFVEAVIESQIRYEDIPGEPFFKIRYIGMGYMDAVRWERCPFCGTQWYIPADRATARACTTCLNHW